MLCIGEQGQAIGEFDPDDTISKWFNDRLSTLELFRKMT